MIAGAGRSSVGSPSWPGPTPRQDRVLAAQRAGGPDGAPGHLADPGHASGSRWSTGASAPSPSSTAFSEAGSSVFTLGFTTRRTPTGSRVVDFVAAGTGLVLVALQIAYLPTLYAAYNRRETLVTLLESRAGAPGLGARAAHPPPAGRDDRQPAQPVRRVGALGRRRRREPLDLPVPALPAFTPVPELVGGQPLAVLDAAALTLAIDPVGAPDRGPDVHPDGLHLPPRHRPGHPHPLRPRPRARPTRSPSTEADVRPTPTTDCWPSGSPPPARPDEAWPHFRGWRVNYEAVAYAVASKLERPAGHVDRPPATLPGRVDWSRARPVDRPSRAAVPPARPRVRQA